MGESSWISRADASAAPLSRRALLGAGLGACAAAALTPKLAMAAPAGPPPLLLARAKAALDRHPGFARDIIAVVDFDAASSAPRFHLVDLMAGKSKSLLVAHGRGSDPGHTGWVKTLSNTEGSAASSAGAYRTAALYHGKHGASRRLVGLDSTNDNAEARAIVLHGAWYVSPAMVRDHGKLGRSEGCFALEEEVLPAVLDRLGEGRLIYANRLTSA